MQDGITSSGSCPSGGLAGTPVDDDAFQTAHLSVASEVYVGARDKRPRRGNLEPAIC